MLYPDPERIMTSLQASALLDKYTEMHRLRRGDLDGSIVDPSRALLALARRFPGSLREIDEIEPVAMQGRIEHLSELLQSPQCPQPEPWVAVAHRYHELLRGALSTKAWLAGRKRITPSMREEFRRSCATMRYGEEAWMWQEGLEHIAQPPQGRLTQVVLTRLAVETASTLESVKQLLFPVRSKRP